MSVIFETLKKLKTESTEKKSSQNKLLRIKRTHFFNNSFNFSSSVLLALLIVTVIGSGTIYGYYYLYETRGENTKAITVSKTDIDQPTGAEISESSEIKGSNSPNQEKGPELNRIEYLPSQVHDKKVELYASNKTENNKLSSVTDKKRSSKTSEAIEKKIAGKIKTESPNKAKTDDVSPALEMEKIFSANAKKNAKIARLIADIHLEMEHGNDEQIEKLFDELVALKGQDNSYILKLKAVWHIHNKEFERAEYLLKRVLSKNGADQEAGINMAIIEIKTQHIQRAYERLKNLREIYPENVRIAEIMQNMKPLLNETQIRHLIRDDKS